jgi:hypothetical protein
MYSKSPFYLSSQIITLSNVGCVSNANGLQSPGHRHPSIVGRGIRRAAEATDVGRIERGWPAMIRSPDGRVRRQSGRDQKGAASMSTQINVMETDVFGTIPAALIVLMTILAMLGVIANVALA